MYANLVSFTLGPGKRSVADKLVAQFDPAIRAREGFKTVTFLADDTAGQYKALVVFDSQQAAQATWKALFPRLEAALEGIVQGSASRALFEVLEP
jgi:heme-degrading monooxygenase HmoA